ncbi:hypothetical protein GH741_03810 [Aquibacillus halophilus]|uniref:Uncharacterized protein n=1 Tax=Aquibacillus halophilus TaxID=930132 RepID=A0A6A8DB86_9BACI|nr:hypothetical protein [Aquibacillus halophilus]MRH41796.1 hypothetical protein [Aquibacillus halophilus]
MAKQGGMMPVIASVGIGAAAYYSMTRGKGVGNMAQQFMPGMAGMAGQGQGQQQNQNQNNQSQPFS